MTEMIVPIDGKNEASKLTVEAAAVLAAAADGPAPVDPDVAVFLGAFEEKALDGVAALDAWIDGDNVEVGHGAA